MLNCCINFILYEIEMNYIKEKLKYIDFIENTTARKIDLKLIKRD